MMKNFVSDMTWEEFRDAVNQRTVFVIPTGSTELAGIHLPLGVDTIAAEGIAQKLHDEEDVLVCPALSVGYSSWFNPFPGTISLKHDTLVKVLIEYCSCLIAHGAKRLLFLNAHRGNNSCIEAAAHILIEEKCVQVGMLNIWKLANDLISGSDLIKEGKFTHGGEIMTSLILKLRPETVLRDKFRADQVKSPNGTNFKVKNSAGDTVFRDSMQTVYQDIRDVTDTGVMGDPTSASEAKGEAVIDLLTDYVRAFLKEFQKIPIRA